MASAPSLLAFAASMSQPRCDGCGYVALRCCCADGRRTLRLQPCGTWAAYKRHVEAGEEPCEACRAASRERSREKYQPRPRISCEAGCGRMIQPRTIDRTCAECRQARTPRRAYGQPPRSCVICGSEIPGHGHPERPTCSRPCGVEYRRRNGTLPKPAPPRLRDPGPYVCRICDGVFAAARPAEVCPARECRNAASLEYTKRRYREDPEFRARVLSKAHNRRADKLGVGWITSPADLIAYLMERDRRRCGICGKTVNAADGPMRPSVDHIVPLSRGGIHALENVQLAHLRCNLVKGDRSSGQMLLVG